MQLVFILLIKDFVKAFANFCAYHPSHICQLNKLLESLKFLRVLPFAPQFVPSNLQDMLFARLRFLVNFY